MKKIIASGVLSQPWVSFPAITQSDDGIVWDVPVQPFDIGDICLSVSSDGTTAVIPNSRNNVAITTNLVNFSYQLLPELFGIRDITNTNGNWIIIGTQAYLSGYNVYPENSEVAQIYISAGNTHAWHMVWSHPIAYSRFYQVRYFDSAPISSSVDLQQVIITCGFADTTADARYSLDYGQSWSNVDIPTGIKAIHSVALFLGSEVPLYIWGCHGRFFKSTSLHDISSWTEVLVDSFDTITDIIVDSSDVIVMCGVNSIYVSYDSTNLRKWKYPGYQFDKIGLLPLIPKNRWIAYARSTLTQYSAWTSTDLQNWHPLNNNVHATGSTLNIEDIFLC